MKELLVDLLRGFNRVIAPAGLEVKRTRSRFGPFYNQDGLFTKHNASFMQDADFKHAYDFACERIRVPGEFHHWRTYVGAGLAHYASSLSGTFCECGVGDGYLSLIILRYLERKGLGPKALFLVDTFEGIDPTLVTAEEQKHWGATVEQRKALYATIYKSSVDVIGSRFRDFEAVRIVQGSVPAILEARKSELLGAGPIGFVHIDMNNATPEVAALKFLFPHVVTGGVILFDDYAYDGYEFQKAAIDAQCDELGTPRPIALPTGQGLILKEAPRAS
jgi:hypothetical protein